ncbi:MAG: glycosyltransferase family 39 protein [Anaerolineae bacterium]
MILRVYRLSEPVLRWDEGWSLAHASLPWSAVIAIGSQEWHPPLYIALLKLWLAFGKSAAAIRSLSVFVGVLCVPLAYLVAHAWSGSRRVGILTALFTAVFPLLVYYSQVTRMYALAGLTALLAAWFMLRELRQPTWASLLGLVLAGIAALYTFYLSAWALLGLWLYGVIVRPRKSWRLILAGLALLAAYLPWLWFTRSNLAGRLGTVPLFGPQAVRETIAYLKPALEGLVFIYGTRPYAATVFGLVLASGLGVGIWQRSALKPLLMPVCVLGIGLLGTAYSARVYWFAVRHILPITPFLGLLLAWALDRLLRLWAPLLIIAGLALGIAYWPSSSSFIYEKTLEVTGPFDPLADYGYLAKKASSSDLVYFNVLAHAGWYETLRQPADAPWSYALSWDPIIEPIESIAARIARQTAPQQRLWFAQYQGDYGSNAALTGWLRDNLYPAGAEWQGDVLFLAFTRPGVSWNSVDSPGTFNDSFTISRARWSAELYADQALAVDLTWELTGKPSADYKVFLHLMSEDGRLVAQHDGTPGSGARPTSSWAAGVPVSDRHALFLPREPLPSGTRLRLLVGMYDPVSGQRLLTNTGQDSIELAVITVK